jgi:hypothetical protein
MSWIQANNIAGGSGEERWAFGSAMDAARRIIPEQAGELHSFFVDAARLVLAGVLHGLGHSSARRVGVVDLVQTVHSYERVTRALRATPKGLEIYRQHFSHSTATIFSVLCVLEDRVLDLVDHQSNAQRP